VADRASRAIPALLSGATLVASATLALIVWLERAVSGGSNGKIDCRSSDGNGRKSHRVACFCGWRDRSGHVVGMNSEAVNANRGQDEQRIRKRTSGKG